MCNLDEGLYENGYNQAVADEQDRQTIVIQQFLEDKTKALLQAGVSQDVVDRIMKSN